MFADYRVPQVLVHFGAMTYDDHLMKLLQEGMNHNFVTALASDIKWTIKLFFFFKNIF